MASLYKNNNVWYNNLLKKIDIPLLFWYYSKVMRKESNELRKIVKETS